MIIREAIFPTRPGIGDANRGSVMDKIQKSALEIAEDLIHVFVVIVLMIVAGAVLYHTICDLVNPKEAFAQAAISAVNRGLFAIVIIDVVRTVMVHDCDGLKLGPFLRVGIISVVREILSVGAHLSMQSGEHDAGAATIHIALMELGVNGAVVIGLAVSLVLVERFSGALENPISEKA